MSKIKSASTRICITTISMAALSCVSVEKAAPHVVVGRILSVPNIEAYTPELMGVIAPVYVVSPISNPDKTVLLIIQKPCPYNMDDPDRNDPDILYRIEYNNIQGYRAELRPGDPAHWNTNAVISKCEILQTE